VAVYGTDTVYTHLRHFSWQCGVCAFGAVAPFHRASRHNTGADFPTPTSYTLGPALPIAGTHSLLRPAAVRNAYTVVQEYQPDVHRLRLSASP